MISSGTTFFLVFTALYLLESVTLCDSNSVILYRGLTGKLKYKFTKNLPEFNKRKIFMAPLFPPAAQFYITGSIPLLFSHKGFFSANRNSTGKSNRLFYSFDQVKSFGVSLNTVRVDGKVFCKTHSNNEAEWWKDKLLCIARANSRKRESEAIRIINEMFNFKHAENFLFTASRKTFLLKAIVNWLFVYCFLIIPAISWFLSFAISWKILLGPFIVMVAAVVAAFIYSYKKIFPSQGIPWGKVISMILYTPALLRCMDIFNKTSLIVLHPAAVARAFDSRDILRELLSYYYREYSFTTIPQDDVQRREVVLWYRKHAIERILAAAEKSNITLDELLAPPVREEDEIITYCPLCHVQYVLESGTCSECGTKLEAYTRD